MPLGEAEEANRLIDQNLDPQNSLDDLTSRMDSVKEDNLVPKSENQSAEPIPSECNLHFFHFLPSAIQV